MKFENYEEIGIVIKELKIPSEIILIIDEEISKSGLNDLQRNKIKEIEEKNIIKIEEGNFSPIIIEYNEKNIELKIKEEIIEFNLFMISEIEIPKFEENFNKEFSILTFFISKNLEGNMFFENINVRMIKITFIVDLKGSMLEEEKIKERREDFIKFLKDNVLKKVLGLICNINDKKSFSNLLKDKKNEKIVFFQPIFIFLILHIKIKNQEKILD